MSYLLIPDMRVQTANIHHSSFLLGGPPVMAAFFFAHAMGRQLGKNVRVNGTAYIHHHMEDCRSSNDGAPPSPFPTSPKRITHPKTNMPCPSSPWPMPICGSA